MLPPILELYIIWHPDDSKGSDLAKVIFEHFMSGPTFSGIVGGGIQVSLRSSPWEGPGTAPRPIYVPGAPPPNGIKSAPFTAIVPLLGIELASEVENNNSDWHLYIKSIIDTQKSQNNCVGIFPYIISSNATYGTMLGEILGNYQYIATRNHKINDECPESMLCRDLTQGIAQLISHSETDRLKIFISHTKHHSDDEGEEVEALISLVREIIGKTRLSDFFDAHDLQPGRDWDEELRRKAGSSAMMALRTDRYSSREWCQREVVIAKTSGMPVVMMDAIGNGEERGSFLMDHVPRIAARKSAGEWRKKDVYRALNLLVDECLKRELWIQQKELARERPDLGIAWWAPHAPELLTLSHWINEHMKNGTIIDGEGYIRILHPDPPLGFEEREALINYVKSTRLGREVDIMTPRQLATRGG